MPQILKHGKRKYTIHSFKYCKYVKHLVKSVVVFVKDKAGRNTKRTMALPYEPSMSWGDTGRKIQVEPGSAEPDASWTPEVRRRTAVELFCGRAGLSRALNKKHFAVRAVDIKRYRYSQKFRGLYCKVGKRSPQFIHKDVLALPKGTLKFLFSARFLFIAPPCKSWSRLQQGKYQRKQSNNYDGQKACREANKLLTFVLQWVAKMDLRKGPNGAPPKQYVALEAPVGLFSRTRFAEELERLGLKPTKITWCAFKETVKKETLLYTNVQSILDKGNTKETFCQPLWDAASKKTICSFSKSPHTPVRGRTHACLHYPEKFCDWVAKCITEQVENDDLYNST